MKKWFPRLFVGLVVVGLLAVGFSVAGMDKENQWEKALIQASKSAGVEVDTTEMYNISRRDRRFVVTPMRGFEQVPATQALVGMDYAFGYFEVPGSDLPAGFYTLRLQAEEINLGEGKGVVDFVDEFGQVVHRMPAELQVISLTVPDPLPFPRTLVAGGAEFDTTANQLRDAIWIHCSNGLIICIYFDSDPIAR